MKKIIVSTLSTLFPRQATNFAYHQLTHPQIKKLRLSEMAVLDKAEKVTMKFKGFNIQTYKWSGGAEKILLVHGWEGQAGNFADLVEKLLEEHYTVYAFDGPSHGFSSTGQTSLFEFTELAGILIRQFAVSKIISHSFGAVAVTYALSKNPELRIDKYVLLATPDHFSERIDDVCQQMGITNRVKRKLIKRFEDETLLSVEKMGVSEFVKKVQVEKALIIHDKHDSVVPIHRARNVHHHWSVSEFMEIEGTGHFRILRTGSVTTKTLEFLRA